MSALKAKQSYARKRSSQETYYNIHCSIDKVNAYQKEIPANKTRCFFNFPLTPFAHFALSLSVWLA